MNIFIWNIKEVTIKEIYKLDKPMYLKIPDRVRIEPLSLMTL